jgi:hypothetical protein
MSDAGYELQSYSVNFPGLSDLIGSVDIDDPPPSEQTPAMLAQSEDCILQVNGGVRVTTVPTTIPVGLAAEFIECMRDAGYEVYDVEIVEIDRQELGRAGSAQLGPALGGFSTMDEVPESAVRECEQELGLS